MLKQIYEVSFDQLFQYAEDNYGIFWNAANDLFFGTTLEYGQVCSVNKDSYCIKDNLSKEQVLALPRVDKAYYIMNMWLNELTHLNVDFIVDCS